MKITRLAQKLSLDGWSRSDAHRLIAAVEEDGVASTKERAAIRSLLGSPRLAAPSAAASRRELSSYLAFADSVPPAAHPRLFHPTLPGFDARRYRRHVEVLAGERSVEIEGRGRVRFSNRFLASPDNQLGEVASFLAGWYRRLDLRVELQPVEWRGRTFHNVVVTIPGRSKESVVLCDHYDVADKEHLRRRSAAQLARDHGLSEREIVARTGSIAIGEAVPGADDNASASAALMEMGALLADRAQRGTSFEKTIRIVHLVGEELPADCLGGRAFVKGAKRSGEAIAAAIVLDMIGVDRTGTRKVQIAPGRGAHAQRLAAEVKASIRDLGSDLIPVLRPHGSRKSFLHQTDGIHFSRAGIPVVLLNEHVNDDGCGSFPASERGWGSIT